MTCSNCEHFQRRGGMVLPAEETCVALERERVSAPVAALLARTALLLARSGECPLHSPLEAFDGCYRAEDLPTRVCPDDSP